MKAPSARAWMAYALACVSVIAIGSGVALLVLENGARNGVLIAAGAALLLQLVAFAVLLAVRGQPQLFLVGWLVGLVLRFAVLGAGAYALARWPVLPRAATLLGYVAFVFVLLMIEPVFLRWDLRNQ